VVVAAVNNQTNASAAGETRVHVPSTIRWRVQACRCAQRQWQRRPLTQRLRAIKRGRAALASAAQALAEAASHAGRSDGEALVAEVWPVLEACRYLEKRARSILKTRRHRRGKPIWLLGKTLSVRREPMGVVLIVGPSNYKLMLAGIQAIQALVAGNGVLLKPGQGAGRGLMQFKKALTQAGLPRGLLQVLDESNDTVHAALREKVDQVVVTGSREAGQAIGQTAAETGTPTIMELSGCDACFVLQDADVALAADALTYGLRFNQGDTCMSPRRVLVHQSQHTALIEALQQRLDAFEPIDASKPAIEAAHRQVEAACAQGAVRRSPSPAADRWHVVLLDHVRPVMAIACEAQPLPVLSIMPFANEAQALQWADQCPLALSATIFSADAARAERVAKQINAGCVLINDMIVPTIDPRLPFEARGASGFGPTRGPEGLLAMTRAKAIMRSRGRRRPYWQPLGREAMAVPLAMLQYRHGRGLKQRWRAARSILKARNHTRPHGTSDYA
jgi:acyl-CoA reductase-like NAD-dependent aldehyde dehydrogenase